MAALKLSGQICAAPRSNWTEGFCCLEVAVILAACWAIMSLVEFITKASGLECWHTASGRYPQQPRDCIGGHFTDP
jgi:hypothetical protein